MVSKKIQEGMDKHRKTMAGCSSVEEWARRFLRKGEAKEYQSIFDAVKEEQAEQVSKKELLAEALAAAVHNVHRDFKDV